MNEDQKANLMVAWKERIKLLTESEKLMLEGLNLKNQGVTLWPKSYGLWSKGNPHWADGDKLWFKGDEIIDESHKKWIEGDNIWSKALQEHIPDAIIEWKGPRICIVDNVQFGEEMNLEKDEFEQQYAERSGLSVKKMRALGLTIQPCDCGSYCCLGWAVVHKDNIENHLRLYGPKENKLRE